MNERICVNAISFPGASLELIAQFWRDLGAHRVGVFSGLLSGGGLSLVTEALARGGHRLETIMHPFIAGHLRADRSVTASARSRLTEVIGIAEQLGARSIYMVAGGHGDLVWEDAAECFCDGIRPCIDTARDAGVALMVENSPSPYADVHIAHTLRDAVTLAEMAGIGVVIDIYGCWPEAGLRETIERTVPRCDLVQIGDYVYGDRAFPARAVPGDGDIPLDRIMRWIAQAGYDGPVDIEIVGPRIDGEGHLPAMRRAVARVEGLLESLKHDGSARVG